VHVGGLTPRGTNLGLDLLPCLMNKAPCGRTFQYEACCQGPARCAVDSYLPRLISSPSS